MSRSLLIGLVLGATGAIWGAASAQAQFDKLAHFVPSTANAVVFVNVEKLMTSPVAVREKWMEKRDAAFASGISFLPPDAKYAVLAKNYDLDLWLPTWEAAVVELDSSDTLAKAVSREGRTPDTINGRKAVAISEDVYLVQLAETMGAFMTPANRQAVSRWLRDADAHSGLRLSPYLTEAYKYANDFGTPLILSLDMEDVVTIEGIKMRLEDAAEFMKLQKLDFEQTAQMLAGIRGLTLGITFNQQPFGKVRVDFKDNVILSPEAAKAALLHALEEHGAMIEEFVEWKPAVEGKVFTIEGHFTESGIQRISSLFDRPPSLKQVETPARQGKLTQEQAVLQASQNYFSQVTKLLDDLKKEKDRSSTYTMGSIGVWMDKYATKIDQLSVLNVDEELVNYAVGVSDSLRAAYSSIRYGAARSRNRQLSTQMPYNYYSYGTTYGFTYRQGLYGAGYWPYGYSGTVAVADTAAYRHERTRVRTEERTQSAMTARDIMAKVHSDTADIRRKMTMKYQVDF